MAISKSRVDTRLEEGLAVEVGPRKHRLIFDEPQSIGGTDKGITPGEALLAGLGACKSISAKFHAEAQGITLHKIRVEVIGEIDGDGFTGENPDAKVGYSDIEVIYHIEADNTEEEIAEFVDFVEAHCPVQDTIEQAPKFKIKIAEQVKN